MTTTLIAQQLGSGDQTVASYPPASPKSKSLDDCWCEGRVRHGGCPLEVFGFNRGRGMCGIYLDGFTD